VRPRIFLFDDIALMPQRSRVTLFNDISGDVITTAHCAARKMACVRRCFQQSAPANAA
jgi:flagellar motor switch protein FliG